MVTIIGGKIVAVPSTKRRILFEEPLLNIEPMRMRFVIQLARLVDREAIYLPITEQHFIECFPGAFRHALQQIFGPHLLI